MRFDELKTPAYVIDEKKLIHNLEILKSVEEHTGCHILLAQKAFSSYALYPLISQYISGTTASGIFEAELGHECMGKENHVFAPAFTDEDMDKLVKICDHVVFNSVNQLICHKEKCINNRVSFGLRVNPEHSTQGDHAIYDPCAPGSRLGVTEENLKKAFRKKVHVAVGSDAGAFKVLHGKGVEDECRAFFDILGETPEVCAWMEEGEERIRTLFRHGSSNLIQV